MKPKKKRLWLVSVFAYALALLLYFGLCGLSLLRDTLHQNDGLLQERELAFDNFYAEGVVLRENDEGGLDLVSTDPDPRLVYSPGEAFYASRFTFYAETSNRPGGEIMLYYTTTPGEEFSDAKRLTARLGEDGGWLFDLGGRRVQALRFDPDTKGGVLWRNWRIVLNEEKPLGDYFLPDARPVFLLLFLPAFASAALLEALRIKTDFTLGRKAKEKKPKGS